MPKLLLLLLCATITAFARQIPLLHSTSVTTSTTRDVTPPTVRSVTPANGAVAEITVHPQITMSEKIDVASVNTSNVQLLDASLRIIVSSVSLSNGNFKIITITPAANLAYSSTYYIRLIAEGVKDLAGNALAAQYQTTFTTALPTTSVLTQHNNLKRTGWNDAEKILNVGNVNRISFGKLFSRSVDDQMYAQPLVVGGLTINGVRRNVVFAATVNNSVYAFDADSTQISAPLWQKNLTYPTYRAVKNTDMTTACGGKYQNFSGNMGIVGTPVIDASTNTLYVVARSVSTDTNKIFVQYLHALDITTGAERLNSPVYITAQVNGNGSGSVSGIITFNQQIQNQRPALLLYNGIVYIAWSSHCDWGLYHGWIMGYDAKTLTRQYVYNNTPEGKWAGIWMSGQGPVVDDNGNIYVTTGNGTTGRDLNANDTINRAESLLKLSADLKVKDFFTPKNYQYLNDSDLDYGVNGVLLIPNSNLSLSGSKEGVLYLIDVTNMRGATTDDSQVLQKLDVNASTSNTKHLHGTPVYFKDSSGKESVFAWAENSFLKKFPLDRTTGLFDTNRIVTGNITLPNGMPGAFMSISSNGIQNGTALLWTSQPFFGNAINQVRPGVLRTFDANDITHELWNSNMFSFRDSVGRFAKFVPPTVANGKVYQATFSNQLIVYGLNPPPFINCNSVPVEWTITDIGNNAFPGNVCFNNGQFNITASGSGIWNISDAFRFTYKNQATGDGEIVARVVGIDNANNWSQAGVMIREDLRPGSRHAFLGVTSSRGIVFAHRNASNGITDSINIPGISAPYWVKLVKQGTQYSAFLSADSTVWTKAGSTIDLGFGSSPVFVGIAHTARTNTKTSNCTVDNINISLNVTALQINFTAQNLNDQKVNLNWIASDERNLDHYEIECGTDGVHFTHSIIVAAKNNKLKAEKYSTFDSNPFPGINYYRLKRLDKNGKYIYSNTVPVNITKKSFVVYPNPATTLLNVFVAKEKIRQINIFSMIGDVIGTIQSNSENKSTISINALAAGQYILEVRTENNVYRTAFVKAGN